MIRTGIVSVTFRQLVPTELVRLAARAGLEGIEWGGDIHVPHGDLVRAREVGKLTGDAGITVASYGSYYRVGRKEQFSFESVVDTACELGTGHIRVWAGEKDAEDADSDYWKLIVDESRRIGDVARDAGMIVSYEFHSHSLTNSSRSAVKLLKEVDHPNIRTYWQPHAGESLGHCLETLRDVLPWMTNMHVFHWETGEEYRKPLQEGRERWLEFFRCASATGRDHWALMEFVKNDDPEAFLEDASVLRALVEEIDK